MTEPREAPATRVHVARPFLVTLVVLGATAPFFYGWWMPAWYVAPDEATTSAKSLLDIAIFALPLGLLGLLAAGSAAGGRGVGAGLSWLAGRGAERDDLAAHTALAAAARAMCFASLVIGLVGLSVLWAMMARGLGGGEYVAPRSFARTLSIMIMTPMYGLVLGRLVLGAAADAAAVRGGRPELRTFHGATDVALVALVVPAAVGLLTNVVRL